MSLFVKNVVLEKADLVANVADDLNLELLIKETNKESVLLTVKDATQEKIVNLLTVFGNFNSLRHLDNTIIRLIEIQYSNKTETIAIGDILHNRWLDVRSGRIMKVEDIKKEHGNAIISVLFD